MATLPEGFIQEQQRVGSMAVETDTIKGVCEKHWNLGNRPGIPRNFVQLSETQAAKIAGELDKAALECEHAWLNYLASLIDHTLVVLPRPHGPLITHGELTILVMDFIGGVAVEDLVKDGQTLSDYDATRICDAYLALRAIKPKTDELCPSQSWHLKGHIFKPFGDGGLVKSSRAEFNAYMDDRLTQAHDGNVTILPRDEIVLNHGDLSPYNIKLLDDGRVAFYDLVMALWGPRDWDLFALDASSYDYGFVEPLQRAFHEKGLELRQDRKDMYYRFMLWHARKGNSVARL